MNSRNPPDNASKSAQPPARLLSGPSPTQVTESHLGQLLVQEGSLKREHIAQVLVLQRRERLRFGDAAVRLGLVKEADIERALATQFDFPVLRAGESRLAPELITAYEPVGRHAEALRIIRAQLMLDWFQEKSRSLAVVEARAGDGASELAANLAITFAQLGERTLLIDGNLRQPRQHALFGLGAHSGPGLSNVLANRGALKDMLHRIEPFNNLAVLCAGSPPPNPQELLGRVNFAYVVETMPAAFDVVIIDTPAALEFADAQLIVARAGGAVLATRRDASRLEDLKRTKAQIQAAGATLLGAVMWL
jgi:chain length determinant protein tyrosine kinase EpsG